MHKIALSGGAFLGFLGVILGAFGAHGLEGHLDPKSLETWETAAKYQLIHALFLVALGFYKPPKASKLLNSSAWLALAGVLLFSGSLYIYSLSGIKFFAMVTPFGGFALILAWFCLFLYSFKIQDKPK